MHTPPVAKEGAERCTNVCTQRQSERERARARERERPAVAKEGAELSRQPLAQLAHRNVLLL